MSIDPEASQSAAHAEPERRWDEIAQPVLPQAAEPIEPINSVAKLQPHLDLQHFALRPRLDSSAKPRPLPNIAHTLLFLIIAGGTLFLTEIAAFAVAMGMHLFGRETAQQLLRDPRLLIPTMAASYLLAGCLAWAIFTNLWKQPFAAGVHWVSPLVRHRFYVFLGVGILLSVAVQLLSNFLPIPKALPIDDFFRTPADIWLVAIFGTFVAPAFEELAFRGFLFPSLASAWDWIAQSRRRSPSDSSVSDEGNVTDVTESASGWEADAQRKDWSNFSNAIWRGNDPKLRNGDPNWSASALVFSSTITSIGFALLHADQLAHSWAPLLVLFAVSLVLCLVRLRAHSLAASTLVHAAYNGTIFVLIFFATDGFRHLDKISQ